MHEWVTVNGIDYCKTHNQEFLCTGEKLDLSDYDRGFIEALIDGEGYLGIKGKKQFPVLEVYNTSVELLSKAKLMIGFGYVHARKMRPGKDKKQPFVYSAELRDFVGFFRRLG